MRKIFFAAALLAAVISVSGQTTPVSIRVTDGINPIAGATVTVTGAGGARTTATTGADGSVMVALPAGRSIVSAATRSAGGDLISNPVEVDADGPSVITLVISATPDIQETVSVSADLPQPLSEVTKTVSVIGGQEMRERADFTLVDSLRSIPGLRIQQLGGFGRTASIKTRGLRNQDTAVLLDGIRLRDASAITGDATPFLSDITLTSVSSVEVLRGSGSSLYGTNAIGGVVDFRTPEPRQGWHGQVSGAAGGLGLGRFRGNISNALESGKFGFNAAVARTVYTKGIDGNDDARNTNLQSRIFFKPTTATNISGRMFFSDAFVKLNSNPDTFGALPPSNSVIIEADPGVNFTPDMDDPDDDQRSKFFSGHLAMSHAIRPNVIINAFYSGLGTSRRNESGPLGVGFQSSSTSIFDGGIHTANVAMEWSNETHRARFGYEFEQEIFRNEGFTPGGTGDFFTRATQASNTLFAQDLVSALGGKLQLAGGVRAQFFRLGQPQFSLTNAPYSDLNLTSPRAALTFDGAAAYSFTSTGTRLRAHVGNGYRVPSLYERFGTFFSSFGTPEFVALGDPNLKPERSIAADAGVEQIFAEGKVRLNAVYFYTKLLETVSYGNVVPDIGSTPRPFGGYINAPGGIARGGEFSGTFKPGADTDIFVSYTLTKSLQRQPVVAGSGVLDAFGIPRDQFTAVVTQRFGRFWVTADALVSSSYLAPIFSSSDFTTYVYKFEGNRRVDLTAGYTFRVKERYDIRLFGTAENLLDNEYYENGFRTAGLNGRIGLSFGF